jgi:hypothetical protein
LKLSDTQIDRIAECLGQIPEARLSSVADQNAVDFYARQAAKRSEAIKRTIDETLVPGQAKRFRQIMIQYREQNRFSLIGVFGASRYLVLSAAAYPGVADELKLSGEQQKELADSKPPREILTDEQAGAIEKMLGEPFKDGVAFGRANLYAPGILDEMMIGQDLLFLPALKLSAEQLKALEAARQTYHGALLGTGFDARGDARLAFGNAVKDSLTTAQNSRLAQLEVQNQAAFDLAKTLAAPKLASKLDLSQSQIDKLAELRAEAIRLQRLRTTYISPSRSKRLAIQMRNAADDRMLAILTPEQQKKWKELNGEPLDGLVKHIPDQSQDLTSPLGVDGRGSFGGFGGQFGQ